LRESKEPFDLVAAFKESWDAGRINYKASGEQEFPLDQDLIIEGVNTEGEPRHFDIAHVVITYTVTRESYLGHLTPSDYRGLIDHLNEQRFLPSYLAMNFPPLESEMWQRVRDSDSLAIGVAGFFVTAEDERIEKANWEEYHFRYLGD